MEDPPEASASLGPTQNVQRPATVFLQGATLAAAFSFWLYLVGAFYLKGYLNFFNADGAWFSPSAFQLVTFSGIPMTYAAAILVGWVYLIHKTLTYYEVSFSAPEGQKRGWRSPRAVLQEIRQGTARLRDSGKLGLFATWWLVYLVWGSGIGRVIVPICVGVSLPRAENLGGNGIACLIFVLLFVASPFLNSVIRTLAERNAAKFKERLEKDGASIRRLNRAKTFGVKDERLLQEGLSALRDVDSIQASLQPFGTYIQSWPVRMLGVLIATSFLVAVSYLAGAAQAAANLSGFKQYEAVKTDKPTTSVWLIFTDGHHELTYEAEGETEGFFFNCPEMSRRLELRWPWEAQEVVTQERLGRLADLIIAYDKRHKTLPRSLDDLQGDGISEDEFAKLRVDAWGVEIRYQVDKTDPQRCEVRSAGPDHRFGTSDDLVVTVGPGK
jgi:hypothetical protein